MKKILFLLLYAYGMKAQTYQNPTFGTVKTKTAPTVTTAPHLGTVETDGTISKITPENLPVSTATTNALDLKTTLSAGAFSGFTVTDNGNGTINVGSGIAYLRATNDQYAPLIKYPISAYNNIPLADNTNNYVVVSYNGGSPALVLNTTGAGIDTQTNSIVVAVARVGSVVHFVNLTGSNSDPNAKIRNRYLQSEGISRATGLLISSTGLKIATTAGITYSGLIRLDVAAIDTNAGGNFTLAYNNGSAWTRTTGQTDINNTQYNNAGILTTMANNKYRTDYAYILVNSPSKLYVIMGTSEYNSLADAQAAPKPAILPVELQVLGVTVARIIVQKSATSLNTASPFTTVFIGSTAQNHNDLAGLQGGVVGYYGHTSNVATATTFTNYYGDVASSGIPQPKTLANTRTEIVTLAAVNAAKPNILTGTGTTNTILKATGTNTYGNSNITDNGTLVSSSVDMTINSHRFGRGSGNEITNVAIGQNALAANTTGVNNVGLGQTALQANTTGVQNLGIGYNSLTNNTTGNSNLGIGTATLFSIISGSSNNVAIGTGSLVNATSINRNTGIGENSFTNLLTGDDNVAIGRGAGRSDGVGGSLTSANSSTLIGYETKPLGSGQTNQLVVGHEAIGLGSNTSVFGNLSTLYGRWWGNLLVGTSTNNGNIGRFNGKVDVNELQLNTTPATASGTPPVLTWNSTTKNVESVPYSSFLTSSNALLTTGNQSFTGVKSGNTSDATATQIYLQSSTTTGSGYPLVVENNSTSGSTNAGAVFGNNNNAAAASAVRVVNQSTSGSGGTFANISTGRGADFINVSTGVAARYESNTSSTGDLIHFTKNQIQTGKVNQNGEFTIPKLIMTGVVNLKSYTVATLPTGTQGDTAYVTDATAPTYLGTLTGGGSVVCPVFFNGTIWVSH